MKGKSIDRVRRIGREKESNRKEGKRKVRKSRRQEGKAREG